MSLQQKNHLHISIFFRAPLFTVEAGIGTPPMKARLVFDTAALLTWTQCQPCIHCFKQDYPVFDLRKSTSYKRLYRNHTLSPNFNCTILECYYYVASHGGLSSQGLVSVHTFSFPGSEEQLKNIAFGCGTHNYGKNFGPAMMFTGVLGMGNSPTSLSHQLGKRGMHRFSYCLPSLRSSKTKKGHNFWRNRGDGECKKCPNSMSSDQTRDLRSEPGWHQRCRKEIGDSDRLV